jgi:hypothetical protein
LFAHVLRIKLNLAGRIFVDPSRNADAARFSERLQSRSHINPVTQEVTVFDDDISLVHRHPELQVFPRGGTRVPVPQRILDSDSGAQRQDCTRELDKHAISRQFEDAPALLRNEGLDDLPRKSRSLSTAPTSSSPIIRLKPTTSAARIATSLRSAKS